MTKLAQLIRDMPVVTDRGTMAPRFYEWARGVTQLQILTGSGSPEGVVEASVPTLYMDTAGTAGSILYVKRDSDVGGDRSQGWILV